MQLFLEASVRVLAEKLGSPEKLQAFIQSGEIKQTESGIIYLKIIDK